MNKLILINLTIILLACGNESKDNDQISLNDVSVITPPLIGDFQNDTLFTIDPTIENRVETPNGSSISIPANSLVDADGNLITDDVDLSFTQYHSMTDIMTSGIPMSYDTLGEKFTFESAGMFTLNALSDNNPVFIKNQESIDVNLASDKPDLFNVYNLNDETGDWTYQHNNNPIPNPKYDPTINPIEPVAANEGAFILDISFDVSHYSELEMFTSIIWEYTGTEDSLDPRKNPDFKKTKWTDFELVPTFENAYEYYLSFTNKKNEFTTKVKASLSGEELELALQSFEDKKLEIEKKANELQKPFIRSVSVTGFGTVNCDYISRMDEPNRLAADFNYGHDNDLKQQSLVFVLDETRNVCQNYPYTNWEEFTIDRGTKVKILSILPGNKLAVYRGEVSNCYGKHSYKFDMEVLDEPINGRDELLEVIHTM